MEKQMQDFVNAYKAIINKSEYPFEEFEKDTTTPLPDITPQDLSGKVVVVTGANAGIGYETAKSLAGMKPKKMILACRNLEKAQAAKKAIEAATSFQDMEVWQLDLSSFASTQEFAKKFIESGLPLDILVSNAGVAGPWAETADGYEASVQVNHLCNVLLIALLHPALKKAAQAKKSHEDKFPRINVVASDNHFWAQTPLPDDPHPVQALLKKQEGSLGVYPSTKLLNVLFAKAYAARCPDAIWICSSSPGYTESELGSKDPASGAAKSGPRPSLFITRRTTYEGAKTIIEASIDPKVGASGGYYSNMAEARTRSSVQGEIGKKFADNVWNDTMEILKKHVPNAEIYSW